MKCGLLILSGHLDILYMISDVIFTANIYAFNTEDIPRKCAFINSQKQ